MNQTMIRKKPILLASAMIASLVILSGCVEDSRRLRQANSDISPELAGAWYQVHFSTSEYKLDARAEMIVESIAYVVVNSPDSRVTIIGKTDAAGLKAENLALSHKRADQVRDALIAGGVSAARIETTWTGEAKLTVVTDNDVAEAANRVVDVTVIRGPR